MSDFTENLWITLVLIGAKARGLDFSNVPECVLSFYAQQDWTVGRTIEELSKP